MGRFPSNGMVLDLRTHLAVARRPGEARARDEDLEQLRRLRLLEVAAGQGHVHLRELTGGEVVRLCTAEGRSIVLIRPQKR